MFRRALIYKLLIATALIGGVRRLPRRRPHRSRTSRPPSVAYTLTPERIAASVAAVVGLIGAVIGGLALAAPPAVSAPATGDAGRSWPWQWGRSALVIGGLVVATADGGLGTGNGLGGGIVAMVAGADRRGPRRAGSGSLAPHRLTAVRTASGTIAEDEPC